MSEPLPVLSSWRVEQMPAELIEGVHALQRLAWPPVPDAPHEITPESQRHDHAMSLYLLGGVPIACAGGFARRVSCNGQTFAVLALCSVCTHPAHRMKGLAAALVREQFARVDRGEFAFGFFQTPVPRFYEKLGARIVPNRVVNSLHATRPEASPFWDPFAMAYAPRGGWPEGTLDLLGPGY